MTDEVLIDLYLSMLLSAQILPKLTQLLHVEIIVLIFIKLFEQLLQISPILACELFLRVGALEVIRKR